MQSDQLHDDIFLVIATAVTLPSEKLHEANNSIALP